MNVVLLSGRFKMNISLEWDENSHCEVVIFIYCHFRLNIRQDTGSESDEGTLLEYIRYGIGRR